MASAIALRVDVVRFDLSERVPQSYIAGYY
jgi:hypothetical protein